MALFARSRKVGLVPIWRSVRPKFYLCFQLQEPVPEHFRKKNLELILWLETYDPFSAKTSIGAFSLSCKGKLRGSLTDMWSLRM